MVLMVVILSSVCYVTLPLHRIPYSDQAMGCNTEVLRSILGSCKKLLSPSKPYKSTVELNHSLAAGV